MADEPIPERRPGEPAPTGDAAADKGVRLAHTPSSRRSTRARAAEVHSTTGTAPIRFRRAPGGRVLVSTDDGQTQVYDGADLLLAALGMMRRGGIPTVDDVDAVATALEVDGSTLLGSGHLRWIE